MAALSITPDYTVLSTERLARMAHNHSARQGGLALIVAEFGRRIVALETQASAARNFSEHVARFWTADDYKASGADGVDDDALTTLDHLIGRARQFTGIQGPQFDDNGELTADAGYPADAALIHRQAGLIRTGAAQAVEV